MTAAQGISQREAKAVEMQRALLGQLEKEQQQVGGRALGVRLSVWAWVGMAGASAV